MVSGSLAAIEMLSAILSDKKSNAVLPSSLRIHFDKTKSQSRVPYVTLSTHSKQQPHKQSQPNTDTRNDFLKMFPSRNFRFLLDFTMIVRKIVKRCHRSYKTCLVLIFVSTSTTWQFLCCQLWMLQICPPHRNPC